MHSESNTPDTIIHIYYKCELQAVFPTQILFLTDVLGRPVWRGELSAGCAGSLVAETG